MRIQYSNVCFLPEVAPFVQLLLYNVKLLLMTSLMNSFGILLLSVGAFSVCICFRPFNSSSDVYVLEGGGCLCCSNFEPSHGVIGKKQRLWNREWFKERWFKPHLQLCLGMILPAMLRVH